MPHRIAPTWWFAALPAVVTLLLAGLLYVATMWFVEREIDRQTGLRVEQRASLLADRLGRAVNIRLVEVAQLARSAALVDPAQPGAMRDELEWLRSRSPAYVWLGFATPDGTVVAGTQGWLEGSSIAGRPVFDRGMVAESVSDFHTPADLARFIAPGAGGAASRGPAAAPRGSVADVSVPVRGRDGALLGVVAAHTSQKWYAELAETTVTEAETRTLGLDWYIVQGGGQSLARPLPFELPARAGGVFRVTANDGRNYLAAVRAVAPGGGPAAGLGWRALVVADIDVMRAPVRQFDRTLAVFAAVSALVFSAGGFLLAKRATRPFDELFAVVRKRFHAAGGPSAMAYGDYLGVLGSELAADLPGAQTTGTDILLRMARDAQELRQAFDHLPMGVAISTAAFRVQYVNPAYTRMLGWTTAMVQGRRTAEWLFEAGDREAFQQQLQQLDDPPGKLAARFDAVCADGTRLPIHWEMLPILDRAGRCSGVIAIVQDLSSETRAKRRALALSDRLRVFAETATDYALVMTRDNGDIVSWSRGAQALTGLNAEAATGRPLAALFATDERASGLPQQLLQSAKAAGQVPVAACFLRAGGDDFFGQGTLYWLPAGADEASFSLILWDSTSQREAAQRLSESEARLAAVIESASDAIVMTDAGGVVRLFNPAAEGIFGVPSSAMLGQSLNRLLPASARAAHAGSLKAFASAGTSRRAMGAGRVQGLRANGDVIELEASISQAVVGGRTMLTAILRDVTERARADRALVEYQTQLVGLTQQLLQQEKQTTMRLAQSLHDDLGQTLGGMRLIHDAGMRQLRTGEQLPAWVARLSELLADANRQVREVLTDLRPPLLDEDGLLAALDNEVRQRQARQHEMRVQLDATQVAKGNRWPADVEYAAFMIAREAVNNALHHAAPGNVLVRLAGDPAVLRMTVSDPGARVVGAPVAARPGHLGLVGMRERALAIGADLLIHSGPGQGTTVALRWETHDDAPVSG